LSRVNGTTGTNNIPNQLIFFVDNTDVYSPTAASERMVINSDGNVGIGEIAPSERLHVNGNVLATAFLYSSDETLKRDVSTIENPLETVEKLR